MCAVENKIGVAGAARPGAAEQGGLAPKTGAQAILKMVPDEYAKNLIGGIVVDINTDGLPVVQKYDKELKKYRRWTWKVQPYHYGFAPFFFEEVRE